MSEPRNVQMVRVPREEEYYDREAVLGRDASSVFPKEAAQQADANREAMVEALGARKFISETELATIKATRGGTVDDGSIAADKPLAAILAERKAEKDAAFQEQWKQMKTGKNRPLDPEEADFFEGLRRLQAEREAAARQQESAELEAFREAVRSAAEARGGGEGAVAAGTGSEGAGAGAAGSDGAAAAAGGEAATASGSGRRGGTEDAGGAAAKKPAAPLIKPIIKVVPKAKRPAGAAAGSGASGGPPGAAAAAAAAATKPASAGGGGGGSAGAPAKPGAKRQRTERSPGGSGGGGDGSGSEGGGGLAGLLGGYGSGSDDD